MVGFFGYIYYSREALKDNIVLINKNIKTNNNSKISGKATSTETINATSTEAWVAGKDERIKAADQLMTEMASSTDAEKWLAGKEQRIKAADQMMQDLINKKN